MRNPCSLTGECGIDKRHWAGGAVEACAEAEPDSKPAMSSKVRNCADQSSHIVLHILIYVAASGQTLSFDLKPFHEGLDDVYTNTSLAQIKFHMVLLESQG